MLPLDRVAIMVSEENGNGEKLEGARVMATRAICGAMNISRMVLNTVPRKLNTTPMPLPWRPLSFRARGWPSKQAATLEGVPGMCNRMAEIRPPEIAPINRAISSVMASDRPWRR